MKTFIIGMGTFFTLGFLFPALMGYLVTAFVVFMAVCNLRDAFRG